MTVITAPTEDQSVAPHLPVGVVDYDQVKDSYLLSFVNELGKPDSVWLHSVTLKRMFTGWDAKAHGDMTTQQRTIHLAMSAALRGKDIVRWIEDRGNDIARARAQSGGSVSLV